LEHINEAVQKEFNPVALIRIVNRLNALGEGDARRIIATFQPLKEPEPPFDQLLTAVSRGACLGHGLVVLASYQRRDFVYPPNTFYEYDDRHSQLAALSSSFPLVWFKDVPFCVPDVLLSAQLPRKVLGSHTLGIHPVEDFLEWAQQHGSFRKEPLRPPDDPFVAASEALEQIKHEPALMELLGEGGFGELSARLRSQSVAMLEGALKVVPPTSRDFLGSGNGYSDWAWNLYEPASRQVRIRWDAQALKYVVGD
jgi:hypothetical protein